MNREKCVARADRRLREKKKRWKGERERGTVRAQSVFPRAGEVGRARHAASLRNIRQIP